MRYLKCKKVTLGLCAALILQAVSASNSAPTKRLSKKSFRGSASIFIPLFMSPPHLWSRTRQRTRCCSHVSACIIPGKVEARQRQQAANLLKLEKKAARQMAEHEKILLGKRIAMVPDPKKLWKLLPDKILSNYEIVSELGRGGYGCVVLAQALHPVVGWPERVALKLCQPQRGEIPVILKEGLAMQRVKSPLVPKCFDMGSDTRDGGVVWFAMELLEGKSLNDLLVERGPMSAADVCRVGIDVLDCLAQVHAAGLIHRDVKPHNILRVSAPGSTWNYKLIDFGTATGTLGPDRILLPGMTMRDYAVGPDNLGSSIIDSGEGEVAADLLAATFKGLDGDADGQLGAEDLLAAMRCMGLPADSAHAQGMVARYDLDRSGSVDRAEFPAMYGELAALPLSALAMGPDGPPALSGAFVAVDADRNGLIDLGELQACFEAPGSGGTSRRPGRDRLAGLLAKYDANGDGSCSAEEFATMYGELVALQDAMNCAGTHGYMSPEAYNDGALTPASDVWSVGATLFRLAAGQLPFTVLGGTWGKGLVGDLSVEAPSLHTLIRSADPGLADVVARALRKRPAERYRTCSEMRAALQRVLARLE